MLDLPYYVSLQFKISCSVNLMVASPIQCQVVMKELLEAGLLHGDCLTVTGKTVAENLRDTPRITDLNNQVACSKHL